MQIFSCPTCTLILQENLIVTSKEYNKDILTLYTKEGILEIKNLPQYIVFSCPACGFIKKISFEEYFESRQLFVANSISRLRLEYSLNSLQKNNLKEESGFSYCGICEGPFDGDGYCNNDIIAQCSVRRKLLGL